MKPNKRRSNKRKQPSVKVLRLLNAVILGVSGGVASVAHDAAALLLFVAALLVAVLLEVLTL